MATNIQTLSAVHDHAAIELSTFNENGLDGEAPETSNQLEPTDRGASAWKLLAAAFMFEAVLYGEYCIFTAVYNGSHAIQVLRFPLVFFKTITLTFQNSKTVRSFRLLVVLQPASLSWVLHLLHLLLGDTPSINKS